MKIETIVKEQEVHLTLDNDEFTLLKEGLERAISYYEVEQYRANRFHPYLKGQIDKFADFLEALKAS